MNEILIKVEDNVNSFKEGDVLVYTKKKVFKTVNINDIVDKKLSPFTAEKDKIINELKTEKESYKHMLTNCEKLIDSLAKALGGKNNG